VKLHNLFGKFSINVCDAQPYIGFKISPDLINEAINQRGKELISPDLK
jgi:hypothetical protein